MAIKNIIESMINKANEVTGKTDATLTDGIQSLIDGYGNGGSSIQEGYIELDDGVVLPMPNYDNTKNYKSAFVRKNITTGMYQFILFTSVSMRLDSAKTKVLPYNTKVGYEWYNTPISNPSTWTLADKNTTQVSGGFNIDSEKTIVWASKPIYDWYYNEIFYDTKVNTEI